MTKQALIEILDELKNLIAGQNSIILASLNKDNTPLSSYAPFIWHEKSFYIFISSLSSHTENLQNNVISAMLIEDEGNSNQIYARTRAVFQCNAEKILDDEQKLKILDVMKDQHGEIIDTLRSLSDFYLFQLSPKSGRFIKGFGQAYQIDGTLQTITPIIPTN